jgi:hypothetical protein
MNLFTAGLGEPMTSDVEMQRSEDLQSAMSLAHAFEHRANVATPTSAHRFPPRSRQMNTGATASMPIGASPSTPELAASTSASSLAAMTCSRFRCLTPEEMADKRKKGECYFCSEKFSLDHKCATKGGFLMELEEDDDPATVADELGVLLHALTGLCGTNTMQLLIHVKGKQLRALVNSGSTHSFIREAVVHELGLDVVHRPGLTVKVANGECL